ncbi:hypothetical protein ACE6H2_000633 [Prunus campanulata]
MELFVGGPTPANACLVVFVDSRCLHIAAQVGLDYSKLNHPSPKPKNPILDIKWKPPPTGWIKLNFDGSIQNGNASTGFVLRDSDDHVVLVGAKCLGDQSVTVAEAMAL